MSLLADLDRLGDELVTADQPTDVRKVLGALVHYVETGSLEPPVRALSVEETQKISEADAEVLRLRAQVAALEANAAQPAAPAAPAAPPAAPVDAAPAAPAAPVLPPPTVPAAAAPAPAAEEAPAPAVAG